MIGSKNALNFAYALYLRLRRTTTIAEGERKRIVRRWFVMSMLTSRHSGSFESTWEQDIRRIAVGRRGLPQADRGVRTLRRLLGGHAAGHLETTSTVSPYFQTFLASQVASGARGFLSKSITVAAMHQHSGDIHHIVPKDYLQKNGFPDRGDYNQVANYALTETSINISISNKPPMTYMARVQSQVDGGALKLGEIRDATDLRSNLKENAVPDSLSEVTSGSYPEFLAQRRKLMADLIRRYYQAL